MRNRVIDEDTAEPSTLPFQKLSSVPMDRRTPQQKARDVEDILNWQRNPKENAGPETEPFRQVDQLLPSKPGQTPVERANDIDNTLTWLRNGGVGAAKYSVTR